MDHPSNEVREPDKHSRVSKPEPETLSSSSRAALQHPPRGQGTAAGGRYKIFLGMAAGVGKTYRMLQEGHAEAEAGRDVVIGYLEPHGRAETLAQADGLEIVPRRRVTYRDTMLEEMDLPAILRREPELCLIDELAHTNAPGVEHEKRYEDIEEVLAAGIDVFSTLNVQHLESLNDQVTELTGSRVRETVPDSVIASADDVVLVDITPESLIERLLAGKVYPGERVQAALNNFFKLENLSALREVALRQVAEEIEAKRIPSEPGSGRPREERLIDRAAPQAIGERLLALITPRPRSQRVVRRAYRSAQRLGAELDLLWVADREPTEEEQEQIEALRRLASVLGAHLLIEHGQDVAHVAQRVANERGTTYVLMGTPKPRSAIRRLTQPALPFRLLGLLPGVDLRIVADRTQRATEEP
jgi:two-component system, OmpR family, sensor histidine kinase KdpD